MKSGKGWYDQTKKQRVTWIEILQTTEGIKWENKQISYNSNRIIDHITRQQQPHNNAPINITTYIPELWEHPVGTIVLLATLFDQSPVGPPIRETWQ